MRDDTALINALADTAGAVIRRHFRKGIGVDSKADASPVTIADRETEAAIRALLAEHRPGDGVVGEEYGDDRRGAERLWVIDPIDGTRAFIAGRPLFGTLIALLHQGRPVLGLIDQCIIGDRWLGAAGQPTMLNGTPARTRARGLAQAHLGTTSPHAFPADQFAPFERLRRQVGDTLYGGDCHNYGLLASGHLDLVVEAGLKLHDWAALVPVIAGAGGSITDWQGRPLGLESDGRVLAAGSEALAADALSFLAASG